MGKMKENAEGNKNKLIFCVQKDRTGELSGLIGHVFTYIQDVWGWLNAAGSSPAQF